MSKKERVQRTPEEKWEIVQEGLKSGNIAETCRRYGIAPNLYYRWKDEAEQGAKRRRLGGRARRRWRARRIGGFGNWSGRWGGSRWRSRS